jgi:hypothetical protein
VDVCDERPSIQLLALIEARINLVIFCSSETSEPIVEQIFLEKETKRKVSLDSWI